MSERAPRRPGPVRVGAHGLLFTALLAAALTAGCERRAVDDGAAAAGASPPGTGAESRAPQTAPGAGGAAPGADATVTATPLAVPVAAGSGQPHLTTGPDGSVVLSWLQPDGDGYALSYSRWAGDGWGAPVLVARGEDFFANWADLPSVLPVTKEVWIAHWLELQPEGEEAYDIATSMSRDGGATWSAGKRLNVDGVAAEHGLATLFPWGADIGAVWLDGRRFGKEPAAGEDGSGAEARAEGGDLPVGMSLRYAKIAYDGAVTERGEIDPLVCDCCRTAVATTSAGPVVVYRDRTPGEIRDVAATRPLDAGWSPARVLGPDNWHIEGCPINGPAVAARGTTVAAAWFTAARNEPKVRLARSGDAGVTFGPPVDVDGAGAFGQVGVVLLEDGAAVVSWWRRSATDKIELAARRVEADGTLGATRRVASNATARPLDVPQMAAAGDRLVFAWTDAADDTVKSAAEPIW